MEQKAIQTPPPSPRKMTYEEFLEWLDSDTHAEWVDGEVVYTAPISGEHNDESGFLLTLFREYVNLNQLGVVRYEPFQMKTGPNLPGRSPDILFVARENLARLKKTFLDGPADLVVEIVSPDDPDRDRVDKFGEYEPGGVREYWLIDLTHRQAELYALGADGRYHLLPIDADGIFRNGALPGFWLKVEWLWQDPKPTLLSVLKEWGLV